MPTALWWPGAPTSRGCSPTSRRAPRERFTLKDCDPTGTLGALLDRLPAFLGDLTLRGAPPDWWGEDLGDVHVLAQRPGTTTPGTVDIDLDGFVRVDTRGDAVERPDDVTGFVLTGRDGSPFGVCREVTGVFRPAGAPPVPRVRLRGCVPGPALRTAVDALGRSSESALRRRLIRADVHVLDDDGQESRLIDAVVSGTVTAASPSTPFSGSPGRYPEPGHRPGLPPQEVLDVTVDSDLVEPPPTGFLDVLAHWRAGRPTTPNLWSPYDRKLRHRWSGVALAHHRGGPDRPPGATYHLDGRFVTDVEGFYCAIGEAVNGPGGYFGWNLDALDDCFSGGFGARPPFRLVWSASAVARDHLRAGYDRRRLGPAVTMDDLLSLLAEHHVEVDLR